MRASLRNPTDQQWSGSTWSKQVYTTVEDCLRTWIKEVKDRWDA
jgi:hypothetical protein